MAYYRCILCNKRVSIKPADEPMDFTINASDDLTASLLKLNPKFDPESERNTICAKCFNKLEVNKQ